MCVWRQESKWDSEAMRSADGWSLDWLNKNGNTWWWFMLSAPTMLCLVWVKVSLVFSLFSFCPSSYLCVPWGCFFLSSKGFFSGLFLSCPFSFVSCHLVYHTVGAAFGTSPGAGQVLVLLQSLKDLFVPVLLCNSVSCHYLCTTADYYYRSKAQEQWNWQSVKHRGQ